jgi:hypothetical protein
MAEKNLVTQGEVANVIQQLGVLADNLNDHVNASLSKAHGLSGLASTYQSSSGNYESGPAGAVMGQQVLRITVENEVYYAPAQFSGGLSAATPPVLQPDISLSPYTGIVSPQQADPALDLTVGSPTPDALVTGFADTVNADAYSANAALLAHAGSPAENAHGGLTAQPYVTLDDQQGAVGRSSVILTVAGQQWRIVCDVNIGGPAQQAPGIASLVTYEISSLHQDPALVQTTMAGTPGVTYTATFKIRGVMECKDYVNIGVAGSPVGVSPVPPAASTPDYCFQFSGTSSTLWQTKQQASSNPSNEYSLVIGPVLAPKAVYLLNNLHPPSPPTCDAVDYTFTASVTTGDLITLIARSVDGNTAQNPDHLSVTDNSPPLLLPFGQPWTKGQWFQVDALNFTAQA